MNVKNICLLIVAVTAILSLFSCGQKDKTCYEGVVYEYGTEKPIKGAKLAFSGYIGNPEFGSPPIVYFIDSVFTDKDGKYSFMDEDEDLHGYEFTISATNYFGKNDLSPDIPFHSKGRDNIIDISLDPYAYLTIEMVDTEEVEGSYISIAPRFSGFTYNIYKDSTLNGTIRGNRYHEFHYSINNSPTITDSIYLEAFEEKTITIEF